MRALRSFSSSCFASVLACGVLLACGGSIAPDGSSSGSTSQTSSSGGTSGGSRGPQGSASQLCTPGAYVFCRCQDRSEGTKQCGRDGASFDACTCDPLPPAPSCEYPAPSNPAGCPADYSYAYSGKSCDNPGLKCTYPGRGDAQSDGCFSTALLLCQPDAAGDAGSAHWTAAQ